MKRIVAPIRLLDARSGAPEGLRRLLADGRGALSPTGPQLQSLAAHLAPQLVTPPAAPAPPAPAAPPAHAGVPGLAPLVSKGLVAKLAVVVLVSAAAAFGLKQVASPRTTDLPVGGSETQGATDPDAALAPPPPASTVAEPAPSVFLPAPARQVPPLPSAATPTPPMTVPKAPMHPTGGSTAESATGPGGTLAPAEPPPPWSRGETELELLTRARALVDGSPKAALGLLDEHHARFPHGALEQEAEVLAIESLVRMGRTGEARARAAAFRATFPQSAHLRRIAVLLGSASPDR